MKKFLLIPAAFSFILTACSGKKIPDNESLLGLDYYPTTAGKYVIYDVDSTLYLDLPVDTISYKYRIKEKIADSFTDNEGKPAIRLERYIKKYNALVPYDSMAWTMKEVWLVNATNTSIQVVENNVRYTKLAFPLQEKMSWNGNAYNTLGEWLYTVDYMDNSEAINGQVLQKVTLIKQKDFKTLISWQAYSEKYARGIGLVSREIIDIQSNTILAGIPVEKRIESGTIYKQILVNYGYE